VNAAESEIQKIAQEANPTPLPAPAETAPIEQAPAAEASLAAPGHLTPAEATAQLELDIPPTQRAEKQA
jgi:hypothetical protein